MSEPSLILLLSFAFSLLVALLIYWLGGKASTRVKQSNYEKFVPYACGEEPPKVKEFRINLERFFIFTVYFLIFDVFAFLIAISWFAAWPYPLVYSIIVLLAVLTLLITRRRL
ncbi:MAG: NADH-quinone oxidoreductase subunit A [Candidatus Nezhaarchaeales archaeon]